MENRKEKILFTIIKEHIATGLPVGSGALVDKYELGVSSATVRNEMADLEEDGYIMQPHTSAGRIPTEKAYQFYLGKLGKKQLSPSEAKKIDTILGGAGEKEMKETAKYLAQTTGNTVFWAFHKHNLYYNGISNLFGQPEFSQINQVYDISLIIDRMDEIMEQIFDGIDWGVSVKLGSENPFSPNCSTIFSKYRTADGPGLFGILAPLRMDYEKNMNLVKYINSKLIAD